MPRGPRDDAPGAALHVMLRGIERRALFADDVDRAEFVRRLDQLAPELGFRCFAWALMPNHVHLVVRSGPVRVSRLLARLGTGYAVWFNRRHDRAGHLFQNRFRARRVVDDADLFGLVLYVLRNPLEASRVRGPDDLETHPWCGLGALLGRRAPHAFEATEETLALFGRAPREARARLRTWLGGDANGHAGPDEPAALSAVGEPTRPASEEPGGSLDDLLLAVCAEHGVATSELRSPRRTPRLAAARTAFALRASRECGVSGAEIGRRLGRSRAAVSLLFERERSRRNSTT